MQSLVDIKILIECTVPPFANRNGEALLMFHANRTYQPDLVTLSSGDIENLIILGQIWIDLLRVEMRAWVNRSSGSGIGSNSAAEMRSLTYVIPEFGDCNKEPGLGSLSRHEPSSCVISYLPIRRLLLILRMLG
jgi:hypothetical protein